MKFNDTGLLQDKLVEEAFNYAYEQYRQFKTVELLSVSTKRINRDFDEEIKKLDAEKTAGKWPEESYVRIKDALTKDRDYDLKYTKEGIERKLDDDFREDELGCALELQSHSDRPSPPLLAAALLLNCSRDPVEYKRLEEKFGGTIAGVVAEVLHVESYPAARETNVAAACGDAKRILLAAMTHDQDRTAVQAAKSGKYRYISLWGAREQKEDFSEARLMQGNDKKLDVRLVDTFNRAAEATASTLRIEVEKGTLDLVRIAPKNLKKPAPGKNPGSFGDDGF